MPRNKKLTAQTAEHLRKTTNVHFSKGEIEQLLYNYQQQIPAKNTNNPKMDRGRFRDLLQLKFDMTDDILMDRVFRVFDKDSDGIINMEEWVKGMSTFLRGSLEEKIKFTFNVYDINSDGFISREEMFQMLKHCIKKPNNEEDPDEGVKELVDNVLKKMDHDHDGRISVEDFEKSIRDDSLLLEAFGPCLPSDEQAEQYLELLQGFGRE